ncbi:MAG TPA: (Fe-S)-binding protein, partial [Thermoanaerobaculia bacterium]|nr:(Fe-S)-binding protein [Thermoanaerobaculia bacterium]
GVLAPPAAPTPEAPPGITGASPNLDFHNESLSLEERMKMAAASGAGLGTNLFAAMAQTDCGACGWDCEGYATALSTGETKDVSLCVPGESETLDALVSLMKGAGLQIEGA